MSASWHACFVRLPYCRELDIVAQRHGHSVSLVHSFLLQASGERVGVAVERFVCEDGALVVRDDAIGAW